MLMNISPQVFFKNAYFHSSLVYTYKQNFPIVLACCINVLYNGKAFWQSSSTIYILTSNAWKFQFLHIFIHSC